MTARPLRPATLCLLGAALLIPAAWAQPPLDQPSPQTDVFVEDSPEAAQALAALAAMESQPAGTGQWRRAAGACHEIRRRFGSKLLRLDQNRYTSVANHLAARIGEWPADGLRQYQDLLEPQAHHLLAQARAHPDLSQLLKLADDYVCTPSGTAAADLAADLALEAGRFDLAASLWSNLLEHDPPSDPLRTNFSLKLLACRVLAGRHTEAESFAAQILAAAAGQQVAWQGRPQPVSQVVHDLLAHRPPATQPSHPAPIAWPPGGPGLETQPAPASLNPDVLLWSFPTVHQQAAESVPSPALPHCLPVIAADRVYVQSPTQAWALDLDTGTAVWTYAAPSPQPTEPAATPINALPSRPALAGGRLYACFAPPSADSPESSAWLLACLDAATGQELWRIGPGGTDPSLTDLHLDPCPLYYDGQLYIVARRPTSSRLQATYLLQFDAATGRPNWRTHIGSAPLLDPSRTQTPGLPAAADDVVYVHSNAGTVAALTAHNGQVRWLYRYDRPEPGPPPAPESAPPILAPSPAILWRDKLLCLPADADAILILDQADGRLAAAIPTAALGPAPAMLGLVNDRLFVLGPNALACCDLPQHRFLWQYDLADNPPTGLGGLTAQGVYIPTKRAVQLVSLDGHLLTEFTPQPIQTIEGNLLALPDRLLLAGQASVAALGPKDQGLQRLRDRITAHPDQPVPRLDLAELGFRLHQFDLATEALDQAIDRLHRAADLADGQAARAVQICLTFADELAQDHPNLARQLYVRAGDLARAPDDQLRYRLGFAQLNERQGRFDDAVSLYQQILADPTLRQHPLPGPDGPVPAGSVARQRIDQIIQQAGRDPYRRFDLQAAELLQTARTSQNVDRLQEVIQQFPNSLGAPQALLSQAELLRRQGQPRAAARLLGRALTAYPTLVDQPAVMRDLAQTYLQADAPTAAAGWLAAAARRFPNYRFESAGQTWTFAQYLQSVLADLPQAAPPEPNLSPPLQPGQTRSFPDQCVVLDPLFTDLPGTRLDVLLVYTARRLHAFNPAAQPLWPEPVSCPIQPTLLGTSGQHAILATPYQVFAVQTDTGQVAWRLGQVPAELDDANLDPETIQPWHRHLLLPGRLISVRRPDQAVCVDPAAGTILWQRPLPGYASGPLAGSSELLAYAGWQQDRPIVGIVQVHDGQLIQTLHPPASGPVSWVDLAPDATTLVLAGQTFSAWDPYSGRRLWTAAEQTVPRLTTIQLGLDGLYFSPEGRTIVKRNLDDGATRWQSQPLTDRDDVGPLTCRLDRDRLLVLADRFVATIDAAHGTLLWRGAAGPGVHFHRTCVAKDYVVAVSVEPASPGEPGPETAQWIAYFYDRRHDAGLLPPGGLNRLGSFDPSASLHFRDSAIVIENGTSLVFVQTRGGRH